MRYDSETAAIEYDELFAELAVISASRAEPA
jgi:hypothetical protein